MSTQHQLAWDKTYSFHTSCIPWCYSQPFFRDTRQLKPRLGYKTTFSASRLHHTGCKPIHSVINSTGYSLAECAWAGRARSPHAEKVDPVLNTACCYLTGCFKPTHINDHYSLTDTASPDVCQDVASRVEHSRQCTDPRHPLHDIIPTLS